MSCYLKLDKIITARNIENMKSIVVAVECDCDDTMLNL
jgi:hypothetical protein